MSWGKFVGGVAIGALIGLPVAGFMAGFFSYAYVKKVEADVRRGWNLMPVAVAEGDFKPGTVLTFDKIAQRSIPDTMVTGSIVKPDSVSYVANQRLEVGVSKGEPLRWAHFAPVPEGVSFQLHDACSRSLPEKFASPHVSPAAIRARFASGGGE